MVRIFLISLILIACLPVGIKAQSIKKQFQYLHGLIGSWESINDKPGQRTVETWSLKSQGLLKGNSITLKGQDTVFRERLTLMIWDNRAIYYIPEVDHNPVPVFFKLTEVTETSFICENPIHDFPKKIAYYLKGDKLVVEISGDGKNGLFNFRKIKG